MAMEEAERRSNRSIPVGITNQRSNAPPRPQIRPAPGVVARLAKKRLNASPKIPPPYCSAPLFVPVFDAFGAPVTRVVLSAKRAYPPPLVTVPFTWGPR